MGVVSADSNGDGSFLMADRIQVHAVIDGGSSQSRVLSGVLVELHGSEPNDFDSLLQRDEEGMIATAVFDISLLGNEDDGERCQNIDTETERCSVVQIMPDL